MGDELQYITYFAHGFHSADFDGYATILSATPRPPSQ